MQHGKCCYCEAEIPVAGHAKAVEHFAPKSKYTHRRNDWGNLLLVCPQCNGKKSDEFPVEFLSSSEDVAKIAYLEPMGAATAIVIDPADARVDPEAEIAFAVDIHDESFGLVRARGGSRRGARTIRVIGLDSHFNAKRHRGHLFRLHREYLFLREAEDQGIQHQVDEQRSRIAMLMSAKSPLAAVAREFGRVYKLDEKHGVRIPAGSET